MVISPKARERLGEFEGMLPWEILKWVFIHGASPFIPPPPAYAYIWLKAPGAYLQKDESLEKTLKKSHLLVTSFKVPSALRIFHAAYAGIQNIGRPATNQPNTSAHIGYLYFS